MAQTVPDGAKAFTGQAVLLPVHVSWTSHGPAETRQTYPEGLIESAGHAVELPLQVSWTSHAPAAARQT